ncbi:hypothetical protein [Spirosoma sp. KUDC1026]|uniref:hypothetical protein n=1 Tax=Spirosoma sp. KUDC1026 TaxID=2745947 RepID=UPI00159BB865|nr:hypothetical protein [Spirosoma sp. KUDC1026]QKZ14693.1 hypothetical protein HU175_19495 [Spirosoma sp. KUDC1026]
MGQYSNEQLSYFSDVAFGYPDKIKKWDEKIAVTIVGACSEADRLEVQTIVREIAAIIGNDKIELVSDQANVFVYFPTLQQDFEREKQGTLGIDVNGFMYPTFSFSDRLTKVKLYVSPALKGRYRGRVLRHEFCHALGLSGHSKKVYKEDHLLAVRFYGSLEEAEEVDSTPAVIPEADIKAIKLLYDNSIPNGLKRSTFLQHLKKRKIL